jgi:integrase
MTGGAMVREPAGVVPLETVLVRYYEHHAKRLASGHQAQYSLKKWSDFFAGALVSELTPDRQRAFIASLRNRSYSDGYIRRVLQIGQAALNRALREGEIAIAPKVLVGEAPEGEARERILSMKEAATLLSAAHTPQLAMFLLLAFGTAARPSAILELTTFQVDCDARLIRFNTPGRRQNRKRRPTVPICDTLLPYLRALPAGPVVAYFGKPIKNIRKTFERARDRTGLATDITLYCIRHTVATELRKRGVALAEVAGFLGHSTGYRTTERYAKYGPDHLSEAVRAVDAYFTDLSRFAGLPQIASGTARARCGLAGRRKLVEQRGIEPLTSTLRTSRSPN